MNKMLMTKKIPSLVIVFMLILVSIAYFASSHYIRVHHGYYDSLIGREKIPWLKTAKAIDLGDKGIIFSDDNSLTESNVAIIGNDIPTILLEKNGNEVKIHISGDKQNLIVTSNEKQLVSYTLINDEKAESRWADFDLDGEWDTKLSGPVDDIEFYVNINGELRELLFDNGQEYVIIDDDIVPVEKLGKAYRIISKPEESFDHNGIP